MNCGREDGFMAMISLKQWWSHTAVTGQLCLNVAQKLRIHMGVRLGAAMLVLG